MPRPKKEQPNHAGGLYEVKITTGKTMDGKLIRKSFYSSTSKEDAKRQAEAWRIEREVAERAGDTFVEHDPEFSAWAERWLSTYVAGKVKDNSYSSTYEIPMRLHIAPHFKGHTLSQIRPTDVQKYLDSKSNSLGTETIKKHRACLKKMFDTAIENKLCSFNPVTKNIRIKGAKTSAEKRFYTFEQRDKIVDYAKGHPHGLAIAVMLYTGISRSELLGIKWEDVTQDCTLHIRRGVADVKDVATGKYRVDVGGGPKNIYRVRDLPIPQWLYELFQLKSRTIILGGSVRNKTPAREVETEYIFHNAVGGAQSPHNFSYYVYKPFMADMAAYFQQTEGVDIPILNPHELRHTAATLWALSGVDVYTIAKLGGWSDLKMISKVYGHADLDAMRNALGY